MVFAVHKWTFPLIFKNLHFVNGILPSPIWGWCIFKIFEISQVPGYLGNSPNLLKHLDNSWNFPNSWGIWEWYIFEISNLLTFQQITKVHHFRLKAEHLYLQSEFQTAWLPYFQLLYRTQTTHKIENICPEKNVDFYICENAAILTEKLLVGKGSRSTVK